MRNHRHATPPEPDYKALAEDLATQLHIFKLRYYDMLQSQQDEEKPQNRQPGTVAGHRFWPYLCHHLFHRVRHQ